jgi:hypothetical protein
MNTPMIPMMSELWCRAQLNYEKGIKIEDDKIHLVLSNLGPHGVPKGRARKPTRCDPTLGKSVLAEYILQRHHHLYRSYR